MEAQMRMAALYLRVSTDKQTVKNQEIELRQVAGRRGWTIAEGAIYSDSGIPARRVGKIAPASTGCLRTPKRASSTS
jgi:Resolvase, N terminal domain